MAAAQRTGTSQEQDIGRTCPEPTAQPTPVPTRCPLCGERAEVSATDQRFASVPGSAEAACLSCGLRFPLGSASVSSPAPENEPAAAEPGGGDFDRWLAGEPIQSRQLNDRQRLWRWCRKRAVLSGLLASSALTLLATAIIGVSGYCYTSSQLDRSNLQRGRAEQRRRHAESIVRKKAHLVGEYQRQVQDEMAARRTAEQRFHQTEARRLKAEQDRLRAEQQGAVASRQARIALAEQLAHDSKQFLLAGHPRRSLFLAGEALHVQLQESIVPNRSTQQTLRDALSLVGRQGLSGHQGPVRAMAFSPDGRLLATGSCDKTTRVWDLWAEDPVASAIILQGHRCQVSALAISPDGRWLATAGHDSFAILWDLTAADPSAVPIFLEGHRGQIPAVAISADSRWLVTGDGEVGIRDNVVRLWDLTKDNPAEEPILLRGHEMPILAVAVSPDGAWVAGAGQDKTVRLWNLRARFPAGEQTVLRGHEGWVGSLAVSPDSRWLVSGSRDGTARLWDLRVAYPSREPIVLRGHRGWIAKLTISPDGRRLATGGFDKAVRLWDLTADDPSAESVVLEGHTGQIQAVAFSPDGRWLITGSLDKTVGLWDLAAEDPAATQIILRGHQSPIHTLAVSPQGRWLATGGGQTCESSDDALLLWDLRLDSLLGTARLAAARCLSLPERQQLLLEAGKRRQPLW